MRLMALMLLVLVVTGAGAALAAAGDTEAVSALAALIAGCAEAHAVGESARADDLWRSTLAMLAPGSD